LEFLHNLQWVLPLRNGFTVPLAFGLSWLGYWVWSKERFFRLLVIVAANALVNAYAKDLFQDPRPALELRLDDLVGASYGLPSGHAQMAVALYVAGVGSTPRMVLVAVRRHRLGGDCQPLIVGRA
jgi:membrane-associated phospholipid phosphatase